MAALIRHGLRKCSQELQLSSRISSLIITSRSKTTSNRIKPNPFKKTYLSQRIISKIDSTTESVAARGFLRPIKEYSPPTNVASKINEIFTAVSGEKADANTELADPGLRFAVFNRCFEEFKHDIPNSLLHSMETLADVISYYETEVSPIVPLDAMKKMELPPNLHIQYDYHRFHPDTDTMFGGISAFTKSSTIVTGLKYKKKYKGHKAKTSWP